MKRQRAQNEGVIGRNLVVEIFYGVLMRLIFLLLSTTSIMVFYGISHGQYGNIWALGTNAGIDFNSDPPKTILTSINTKEGSASIADAKGELLFYTDGGMVWDRNNSVMPNARDLPGLGFNITSSTAQGALIVPIPGTAHQYYVFSLGAFESGYVGELYYSIVDMSLNNGLGDVLPASKGKLLTRGLTEHLTAVSGNNCNIWLLAASRSLSRMQAYNIDYRGIDTVPVTSARIAGTGQYNVIGTLDVSPDRTKIAMAQGNIVLYDFDPGTGIFSNSFLLDPTGKRNFYGIAFSSDNTKLYASGESDSLHQFDLSSSDTNVMRGTRTALGKAWAVKRGPDGKIYAATNGNFLAVVQQPNLAGIACSFELKGLKLADNSSCQLGVPNAATIVVNEKNYSSVADTAMCADSFLLVPRTAPGFNHRWEDGSRELRHYVKKSGTYWVSYQVAAGKCEEYMDTFHIAFYPIARKYSTTLHTGMCKTDTIVLRPRAYAAEYTWEDGSTSNEKKINRTGIYWVAYRIDSLCEQHADTFIVDYPVKEYEVSFVADTLACVNHPVSFQNTSDAPFNQFQWFFGDEHSVTQQFPAHAYIRAGFFEVTLIGKIGNICADTTIHFIAIDSIFPLSFLADRNSICTGEKISFRPSTDNTTKELLWQFGDGGTVLERSASELQHAYELHGLFPVTLTAHNRICPETQFFDTIFVYPLPKIDLGTDAGLCLNNKVLELQNLRATKGLYHNLWNTGDTTASLKVKYPGIYSLTVTLEPQGCSNTETIIITKDCYIDIPNAFTPNGDGANDYFFPRQLLSESIAHFKMQVFNRWGQIVFETHGSNGRGWDGRFNAKEQPENVYLYRIEIGLIGAPVRHYHGNVTLLR